MGAPASGRARDASIDARALLAARELLVERGWDGVTMQAVAQLAGVSRPALYRRWPSKTHLLFDAMFEWSSDKNAVANAQDASEWVRLALIATIEQFRTPEVRAATPGILAAFVSDPELREASWMHLGEPAVQLLADMIRREGTSPNGQEDAEAMLAVIVGGAMFYELVMRPSSSTATSDGLARAVQAVLGATRSNLD